MASLVVEKRGAVLALAKNVTAAKYEHLPARTVEVTKMDILDALGVALAASGTAPSCQRLAELVKEMGGKEESTIIGYGGKVPSYMAAFVNGALVHALNYEDVHDALGLHTACSVFPAALATAERMGRVSGKEFITAYALGMDLECRLARALVARDNPRDWSAYGWSKAQIFGYFGAAAVAGRLLGLDENQLLNAFGLAYSQVGGGKQLLIGGGADKEMYASHPAKAGVLSALMAQRGIAGPKDCLEGKAGLYNVYFQGEYDATCLDSDLGRKFEGVNVGFFAFPSCMLTHSYIEVALGMVHEHSIRPDDVEAITVFVGPRLQALCEPLEIRRNPRNMSEAEYSLPFTVATALTKGKPRIEHFTANGIGDPEILRLSNKISYEPDQECGIQLGTGAIVAKIEIRLRDGRVLHSEYRGFRYGHTRRPIGKEAIIEKFRDCASHSARPLTKDTVAHLIKTIEGLDEVNDVGQIIRLLS